MRPSRTQGNCMLELEVGQEGQAIGIVKGGAEAFGREAAFRRSLVAEQIAVVYKPAVVAVAASFATPIGCRSCKNRYCTIDSVKAAPYNLGSF